RVAIASLNRRTAPSGKPIHSRDAASVKGPRTWPRCAPPYGRTPDHLSHWHANFSGRDTSDLLLRNSDSGGLQVYNINDNQITGSALIGTVGLDWQFSGVGHFSVPGESDLLLRNSSTGALQLYNIKNDQITGSESIGTVGVDWNLRVSLPSAPPARPT